MSGLLVHAPRILACAFAALSVLTASVPAGAFAQQSPPTLRPAQGASIADHIAEAARRFAVPERWIRAVMRAESAFDPRATSHAGAMGLMQVMPGTYAELRARHGLGSDPYAPRDNVLAGAAYLREMHDAFGSPGFLAAYNAGPARYRDHLATGRPLPLETRLYVAKIAPDLGAPSADRPFPSERARVATPIVDPLAAPLFATLGADLAGDVITVPTGASSLFPPRPGSGDRE